MKKLLLLAGFSFAVFMTVAFSKLAVVENNNIAQIEVFSVEGPSFQILTVASSVDEKGNEVKQSFLITDEPVCEGELYAMFDYQETLDFIKTLKNQEPIAKFDIEIDE